MKRALVWLQRNLRLTDNPALYHAQQQCDELLLVYIHDPQENAPWQRGQASLWYLQQSLRQLQKNCLPLKLNICLGAPTRLIPQLVTQYQISQIYWQQNYEPRLYQRDLHLAQQLRDQGIFCHIAQDGLLADLNCLLTQQDQPYQVFTPFYKRLCEQLQVNEPLPASQRTIPSIVLPFALTEIELLPKHTWQDKLAQFNQIGEQAAFNKLQRFIFHKLPRYAEQRDFPAAEANSQLSAALHFGELSARQIWAALIPNTTQADPFIRQLIWREFARYILWHYPHTDSQAMDARFNDNFWQENPEKLHRWQAGETGIDIIDAGMQQLWQTGTMHNRVRMLTASLLCKNLQQPWQNGARWFWDTLIDADLANNSLGWQWVAGCGVDAMPYFRIFNPITQANKFDTQQQYIQRWLPKGKRPSPIIDLGQTRKQALAQYQHFIKR